MTYSMAWPRGVFFLRLHMASDMLTRPHAPAERATAHSCFTMASMKA